MISDVRKEGRRWNLILFGIFLIITVVFPDRESSRALTSEGGKGSSPQPSPFKNFLALQTEVPFLSPPAIELLLCDLFNLGAIIFFIGTPLTFLVTPLEAIKCPIGNGKVATKVKNGKGSQVQRLMMKPCTVATKT